LKACTGEIPGEKKIRFFINVPGRGANPSSQMKDVILFFYAVSEKICVFHRSSLDVNWKIFKETALALWPHQACHSPVSLD
jgi:hypothetical protein